ncbi:uncharacterized protein LOC114570209 [Perca flavescens]|uniref:uncharacterized protein LOC114570209 n=1 Tax=Perca flavescens TaxID=8167 RepID=UPI00106DEBAE|nr:uncharacterized protein LOC114570209 [Perca flavescens]
MERMQVLSVQVLGGTFILQHSSGSSRKTETRTNSATFNIVQVDFHNEGSYQCQYKITVAGQHFTSSSDSVSLSVSLPKPRISMNPVGEVTWGQDVGITCLISTQVLGGTFILQHSSGSSRKTVTRTNSATFNIVQVDFHNEGSYQCQYQTRSPSQDFISPQSNVVRLSVSVPLQQPSISLTSPNRGLVWGPEGAQITRGFSFVFTCSTSSHYPGGVFHLIFSGSNLINTEPAVKQSASFSFPVAEYEQQGNYSCVYEVTLSSRTFTSTQTAPISVVIKMPLQQPSISLTSPNRGLVWGPEGAQITRGFSFVFTCSTSSHYPVGVFHLIFSGSNLTNTEPAVNQSASFSFPVAEYEQQGNYSCVYEVTLSSRTFTSTQTAPISVVIKMHLLPLVSSVAAGGLLLLLLVLVVVCLVCKRRRRAKHTGALVQTQLAVRVRNDSVDKEYDDESDYENVEPMDTKKNLKEEAGKGEEEETNDYVEPVSDEDHDYEEADPRASIIKTNKVYFSVEENREEEEDDEDDYENVDPMDTTKNLKEEAGKGEEEETNDYVEPVSDEDHDYEEAGPSASIMKTDVYFSVEENIEEEEEEDDYENDYEN